MIKFDKETALIYNTLLKENKLDCDDLSYMFINFLVKSKVPFPYKIFHLSFVDTDHVVIYCNKTTIDISSNIYIHNFKAGFEEFDPHKHEIKKLFPNLPFSRFYDWYHNTYSLKNLLNNYIITINQEI